LPGTVFCNLSASLDEPERMNIMNVAIGIGTLLLGGWVLNAPVDEGQSEATAPANAGSVRGTVNQSPTRVLPGGESQQQLRHPARINETTRRDEQGNRLPDTQQNLRRFAAGMMPSLPTDPARAGSGMPLAPTEGRTGLHLGASAVPADAFTGPTAPNMRDIPMTRRASSSMAGHSSYGDAGQSRQRDEAALSPMAAPPPPTKAFSGARQFNSNVSPYMQLFRTSTNFGTVDNYSTLVRPALDQRSMNQQFNMDIYGLERTSRVQNSALRQLGRGNGRLPQSIGTPQFYMNSGSYYPSYGQPGYGQGGY
jgi:hypothetical protein